MNNQNLILTCLRNGKTIEGMKNLLDDSDAVAQMVCLLFFNRWALLLLFNSLCTVDDEDLDFTVLCSEMTTMLSDSRIADSNEDEASSFAFNAPIKTVIPYKREGKNSPFDAGPFNVGKSSTTITRTSANLTRSLNSNFQFVSSSLPYCCLALNRTALLTRDEKLWWFGDEGELWRSSTCRQVRFEFSVSYSSDSQLFLSFWSNCLKLLERLYWEFFCYALLFQLVEVTASFLESFYCEGHCGFLEKEEKG